MRIRALHKIIDKLTYTGDIVIDDVFKIILKFSILNFYKVDIFHQSTIIFHIPTDTEAASNLARTVSRK